MEIEALEELGLTRNEAITYLTLLDLGKSHIGQITERTRMHRRTIYDCLERLKDRGLVSFVIEGKIRYFTATNPIKLRELIKEKEAKIEDILPKLFEISKSSKFMTEVSVHKGKEGLKNIMEGLIKSKPKIWYSLTSSSKARDVFPVFLDQFHAKRVDAKIHLQIVFGRNEKAIKRAKELKKTALTEVRFTDDKYVIPISIWGYNDNLAFMLWDSETGILIKDKQTAETFKNYFKILWKSATS